jgi:vacuolar-type H+-ATPase subunit H
MSLLSTPTARFAGRQWRSLGTGRTHARLTRVNIASRRRITVEFNLGPMHKTAASSVPSAVEAAIGRVLAAEASARDAIAQAERDASATLEAARAKAQDIAARAETRLREAGDAYERETARRLAGIADGARAADDSQASAFDSEHLGNAVAALAASLTGGGRAAQ